MVDSNDYGDSNSKTLVPGTLTVFRHFTVDMDRGVIVPMNSRRSGVGAGPTDRPYAKPDLVTDEQATVHIAECGKSYGSWATTTAEVGMFGKPRVHEKSPTEWCSCGFYAHYDSDTDFYPTHRWGRQYSRFCGNPELASLVVVRAVCEVSGTVVMGRSGVRAEKMKIVALAIDWGKQLVPRKYDKRPNIGDDFHRNLYRDLIYEAATEEVYFGSPAQIDDDRFIEETIEMIAHRYRVKFYTKASEMYDDHPKADISALGVDTSPSPSEESFTAWLNRYITPGRYPVQYGKQAMLYSQGLQGLTPGQPIYDELIRDPDGKSSPSVPQRVQDVIDAKASRPAPPGAGIDRRKGRLR